MTKFFVDQSGNYIGGFDGNGVPVPQGAIEVPSAPADARQKWNGTSFDPVPVIVPEAVTRRQAKQALLMTKDAQGVSLLSKVQPAIDAITDATQRALMQIEWDESLNFERARPTLIQMAAAIGLDSAALDQLFITAATL